MNVSLFAGLDTDAAYSMSKYAVGLLEALQAEAETGTASASSGERPLFTLHYGPGVRLPSPLGRSRRLTALANEGLATHVLYPRQARRLQGDVNHVLDHSYGSLLTALPGERTIVTCHDLIPLRVPGIHPTLYSQMTGRRWYRRSVAAMTRAARIMAISEQTRRDLIEHTGYDPERIVVIPHGIDRRFEPMADGERKQQVRRGLGLPERGRLILHVGNCAPYKNLPALLQILALLVQRSPEPVTLVRVGPPFTPAQSRLIVRLGLGERILRRERVSLEELVRLYHAADVLLFPSLYEGLGLPVAEALACGLPVVASNAASLPEVLGEGQLTFAPDDVEGMAEAVLAVWQNETLRQELVEKGLRQARRFSWPRVAQQVLALYEEVWRDARPRS